MADHPSGPELPPPSPHEAAVGLPPPGATRGLTKTVLASLALPGSTFRRDRRFLAWVLMLLGVGLPIALVVYAVVKRDELTTLVLDSVLLRAVQATSVLFVVTRLVAVVVAVRGRAPGMRRRMATFVAVLGVLVVGFPAGFSVVRANQLSDVIGDVFLSSGSSDPIALVRTNEVDLGDEFQNILLLGGDAGPGRWALRTDTMILVSVHRASGRVAMISIPRNLYGLRFPDGTAMHDEFPKGFRDLTNAVYPYVYAHPDIAAQYLRGDLQPEAVALASGIANSFDVTVHDYVLVNMQGFLEIVDALGGVTMTLDKEIPMPGNIPGAKSKYPPVIGPGEVKMDGTMALGYVRSRAADSDYRRMGRQRQLLEELARQTSGIDVVTKFSGIANATKATIRTSLSTDEFAFLASRLRSGSNIAESFGLVPPLVNPGRPDWDGVADLIDGVQTALRDGVDFPFT